MPTSLEEWFNHWYYFYTSNVYAQNSLTTCSTSTEGVYTYNYYMPQFDIEYKLKKRKLDLE